MLKFTITLLSISFLLFISSCASNTGALSFMVNFPKNSKVLTQSEKEELLKKIEKKYDIKTITESDETGVLEIEIK